MPVASSDNIRRIFLNPRPTVALLSAADLLGMTLKELKRDVENGAIVATSTPLGLRIPSEEMMAAAMRLWEQGSIEAALGDAAPAVLPEAIRLVQLRACVPRYQRDVLVALAQQEGTSVDAILQGQLEDLACANAAELMDSVPTLRVGLSWPGA